MIDNTNKSPPVPERRRDKRIDVDLPFLLSDPDGNSKWHCHSIDVSPTGIRLVVDEDAAPPAGMIVNAAIQGPTEEGWEHINTRRMRVVRSKERETGLTYTDLDTV